MDSVRQLLLSLAILFWFMPLGLETRAFAGDPKTHEKDRALLVQELDRGHIVTGQFPGITQISVTSETLSTSPQMVSESLSNLAKLGVPIRAVHVRFGKEPGVWWAIRDDDTSKVKNGKETVRDTFMALFEKHPDVWKNISEWVDRTTPGLSQQDRDLRDVLFELEMDHAFIRAWAGLSHHESVEAFADIPNRVERNLKLLKEQSDGDKSAIIYGARKDPTFFLASTSESFLQCNSGKWENHVAMNAKEMVDILSRTILSPEAMLRPRARPVFLEETGAKMHREIVVNGQRSFEVARVVPSSREASWEFFNWSDKDLKKKVEKIIDAFGLVASVKHQSPDEIKIKLTKYLVTDVFVTLTKQRRVDGTEELIVTGEVTTPLNGTVARFNSVIKKAPSPLVPHEHLILGMTQMSYEKSLEDLMKLFQNDLFVGKPDSSKVIRETTSTTIQSVVEPVVMGLIFPGSSER